MRNLCYMQLVIIYGFMWDLIISIIDLKDLLHNLHYKLDRDHTLKELLICLNIWLLRIYSHKIRGLSGRGRDYSI